MAKRKKMVEKQEQENSSAGLSIPAGVLLGIGFGFMYGNIPAGLFIGLGLGFVLFLILRLLGKK